MRTSHITLYILCSMLFSELNAQFASASNITGPSCPFISPGYIPDGGFSIDINDIASCAAANYDITVSPVASSGPSGSTPSAVVPNNLMGQMSGSSLSINFAGAGNYEVTLSRNTVCDPVMMDDTTFVVTVPDGVDSGFPTWYVLDGGESVVDNDPFTPALTSVVLDGTTPFNESYTMQGIDNCDGLISRMDAVTAISSEGTTVNVNNDVPTTYIIDIEWGVGSPAQVVLTGSDAFGNEVELTLQRNIVPIPTLGQWGIISLSIILLIIGVRVIRTEVFMLS